ncbi:MAG: DNA mismatch repair endonuclease MutL, partial [Lachnospiraceae bacterium]|nr:DNA mismatch repair endonuclease MutL [Lachnospiraceae bacterium]
IRSEYGVESDIDTTTKNDGTEIIIKDLFDKLPVRKKALDNNAKETSKIIDIIEKEALANPFVSFKVIVDDREKLNIKGTGKIQDVIHDIYGRDVSNNILPIDDVYNDIKVMGYIGKPSIMRSNRNDEIYFVNSRFIKSKVIENAIDDAYKTFLMQHKYPLIVLMIKLKDGDVDVNVHPRKQEVLFKNDNDIYNAIYELVRKTLSKKELIHETKDDGVYLHDEIKKTAYKTSIDFSKVIHEDMSFKDFIIKERKIEEAIQDKIDREKDLEDRRLIKKDIATDYHIIGQIFDTYIIISYDDNIYLIDQHAAHEKINFEKLKKKLDDRLDDTLEQEMLLIPIMVSLTKNQQDIIEKYKDMFLKMGFTIERFGDNDYKISSVPMILSKMDKKELLMELIRDLEIDGKNGKKIMDIDIFLDRIASMACKMSIKANDRLNLSDMKNLIDKLFSLDDPYNCPHGRPAIIKVTREELEKKFKRIV